MNELYIYMNETCHEFPVIHSFTISCSVAMCIAGRACVVISDSVRSVVVTPDGPLIQAQCRSAVLCAWHVTQLLCSAL